MKTEEYINKVTTAICVVEPEDINRFAQEIARHKGIVYIIGNGGSNATASHFAEDLVKAAGIKAIAIDSSPLITASSNDNGYDKSFSTGLEVLLTENDLIFAISGSGNSENIIQGIQAGENPWVRILGLLGCAGGKIGKMLFDERKIIVQSNDMLIIEDTHLAICHMIVSRIITLREESGQ